MIPYALFMFKIIWEDEKIDIRALDVMNEGFAFRMPLRYEEKLSIPHRFEVSFLDFNSKKYTEYEITGKVQKSGDEYIFSSKDDRFNSDFKSLLNNYMRMVRLKSEYDDVEVMEELTGIKLSDEYSDSYSEKLYYVNQYNKNDGACEERTNTSESYVNSKTKNTTQELCKPEAPEFLKLPPVDIAISLDEPALWENFLRQESFDNFVNYYWNYNSLNGYSITKLKVTHVYIGNQFCHNLFPGNEILDKLIRKVWKLGLKPVIVLAPVTQGRIAHTKEVLKLVGGNNYISNIELVVNDYGVPMLLKELNDMGEVPRNFFELTSGILLNKRKKDPRIDWLSAGQGIKHSNYENFTNDEAVAQYLRDVFDISRISCDVSSYPVKMSILPTVMHMPLYQTNTSDCMIKSIVEGCGRGDKVDTMNCPGYCMEHRICFSTNIPLIGRWNTIFGESYESLDDFERINKMINDGLVRIVLRA
ncbi:MAG: hypothetical protein MJ133_11650 [Lachnospiraceae bacterium]|nr:hypothetical protein [Lachnospiraceae bacterium]